MKQLKELIENEKENSTNIDADTKVGNKLSESKTAMEAIDKNSSILESTCTRKALDEKGDVFIARINGLRILVGGE